MLPWHWSDFSLCAVSLFTLAPSVGKGRFGSVRGSLLPTKAVLQDKSSVKNWGWVESESMCFQPRRPPCSARHPLKVCRGTLKVLIQAPSPPGHTPLLTPSSFTHFSCWSCTCKTGGMMLRLICLWNSCFNVAIRARNEVWRLPRYCQHKFPFLLLPPFSLYWRSSYAFVSL